ncbi:DNA uptake protein ComE [Pricia antarctica]|uniref:DNA uptake protein ComE n=1 Tax=Pricia antarctica TaxID=641691 RepID=A0A1G7GEJ4_9FLAO|nr:helix-hairpin-helix domain-containing protein [Pricia antarctica]SDE86546.1 DNA uptake protein ComE [Pricia antarctica]
MNKLQSHFRFNKQERSGIFFLLLIIVSLQVGYYFYGRFSEEAQQDTFVVNDELQTEIDSLKQAAAKKDSVKVYPFNPNFITDYKGYVLGMSTDEIDRLHAFRKKNQFANTAEEFQKVTQVSDSLLAAISPHFKFPEWTKNRKQSSVVAKKYGVASHASKKKSFGRDGSGGTSQKVAIIDLNTVTAQELRTINGIGEKLSVRIIKFRDRLGGFLTDDQLYDVYGLEPEVVERTLVKFKVLKKPDIPKINVNTASVYEIASLVYIQEQVAESIVEYRNVNNGILSLEELSTIEGFPSDKIDRIALYLSL